MRPPGLPPDPQPPRPDPSPVRYAAWLYVTALVWGGVWILAGPSSRPHFFFREGGPIDWYSSIQLLAAFSLATVAWLEGRRRRRDGNWFWLVCSAGLAFVLVDERFQLHEVELQNWLRRNLGSISPLRWNDLVLVAYGVIGVVVGLKALPILRRHRRVALFLVVAVALFAVHGALDMLVHSESEARFAWLAEIAEEIAKLLTGASLVLAFFVLARLIGGEGLPADGGRSASGVGWWLATGFLIATQIPTAFMMVGDAEWIRRVTRIWGDPVVWTLSVCLGATALLVALLGRRPDDSRPSWRQWQATAFAAGWFALDEATVACAYRFVHHRTRDHLPGLLVDERTVLGAPGPLTALLVLGLAALVATLAWTTAPALRTRRALLAFSASAFLVDLALAIVVDGRPAIVRVIACATLFLAAVSRVSELGLDRE